MLNNLTVKKNIRTFSVCPENPSGKKGEGGKATLDVGSAANAARELGQGWKVNPYIVLNAGEIAVLADIKGEGAIKHFWITDSAKYGRQLLLRIYFDGQKSPAVDVPLSDFFANADYNEYRQINSLAMCYNPRKGMNCYFEMPYFKGFRVEIENTGTTHANIYYQIDCEEKKISPDSLYFHAQFRRVNPLPYKEVYTILDNIKGNGLYVGTYLHWGVKSNGWWGEGEFKFYMDDDDEFPTICGTGTEDYFGGAWNFEYPKGQYATFSSPYSGLSQVIRPDGLYIANTRFSMYRFHIMDPIYFEKNFKVTVQDLGWRSDGRYLVQKSDISTVAYWYQTEPHQKHPYEMKRNDLEII